MASTAEVIGKALDEFERERLEEAATEYDIPTQVQRSAST